MTESLVDKSFLPIFAAISYSKYIATTMNQEIILLRITGEDRPGLTSAFMEIMAKYDVDVLDIGQADIHSTLSLGILIRTTETDSGNVMKEVLFKSSELNVKVSFLPIADEEYDEWVNAQGKNRYILTVMAPHLTAKQMAAVSQLVAEEGLNIDGIRRLTGRPKRIQASDRIRACVEFSLRGTPRNRAEFQAHLLTLSAEMQMDCSLQEDTMYRRMRRLICFDMDSTLIQTECIDELAERAGVGEEVRAITDSAMRGEIDFKESFVRRVALLKGLDVSVMQDIAEKLPITDGVERLMYVLKRYGYKIAILSGGFTFFGDYIAKRFGIDYVYANDLEVDDNGKLTGNFAGDIVDGQRKAELLKLIAKVEKVDLAQTIAVGDGANDLPMLAAAGLGIAFHAKPRVVENAKQSISTMGLDGVLYFLGFKDSYLDAKGQS